MTSWRKIWNDDGDVLAARAALAQEWRHARANIHEMICQYRLSWAEWLLTFAVVRVAPRDHPDTVVLARGLIALNIELAAHLATSPKPTERVKRALEAASCPPTAPEERL